MQRGLSLLALVISCSSSPSTDPTLMSPGAIKSAASAAATLPSANTRPVLLRPQLAHASKIDVIAYSPDSTKIVSASRDKRVVVWDVFSGKELRAFSLDDKPHWVEFSLDGASVMAKGASSIAVWSVTSGARIWSREIYASGVARSANIIAAVSGGSVFLFQASDGTLLHMIRAEPGLNSPPAFSPDGKYIAFAVKETSSAEAIAIVDTSTGKRLSLLSGHAGSISAIAFSADSTRVASGSSDYTARIWKVSTGQVLHTFSGHSGGVRNLAFHPSDGLLASSSDDKTIRIWSEKTGAQTKQRSIDEYSSLLSFSRDGERLLTSEGLLWELSSDVVRALPIRDYFYFLPSPDARFMAGVGANEIWVYSVEAGELVKEP